MKPTYTVAIASGRGSRRSASRLTIGRIPSANTMATSRMSSRSKTRLSSTASPRVAMTISAATTRVRTASTGRSTTTGLTAMPAGSSGAAVSGMAGE